VVAELKTNGEVDRGWLGVGLQNIDEDLSSSLGLKSHEGALVAEVVDDSPASKAGVRVGDVIVEFNGKDVKNAKDLSKLVGAADAGDKAKMKIWRDDDYVKLTAVLGTPGNTIPVAKAEKSLGELGLSVAPLDNELRRQLQVDDTVNGAVVTRVAPGSKVAAEGIHRGDILLQVDRKPVTSASDLEAILANAKEHGREAVPALIRRGDAQHFAVFPVA